jgi:hypothetical protein
MMNNTMKMSLALVMLSFAAMGADADFFPTSRSRSGNLGENSRSTRVWLAHSRPLTMHFNVALRFLPAQWFVIHERNVRVLLSLHTRTTHAPSPPLTVDCNDVSPSSVYSCKQLVELGGDAQCMILNPYFNCKISCGVCRPAVQRASTCAEFQCPTNMVANDLAAGLACNADFPCGVGRCCVTAPPQLQRASCSAAVCPSATHTLRASYSNTPTLCAGQFCSWAVSFISFLVFFVFALSFNILLSSFRFVASSFGRLIRTVRTRKRTRA